MAVYFIRAGEDGPVKIGTAIDVAQRIAELQIAHYVELILVRTIPGNRAHERALHDRFEHLHIRGEWFHFHPDMLLAVPEPVQSIDGLLPAARVIAKCGGHHVVANALKIDVSRVYRFTYGADRGGTGGLIPAKHHARLMGAFGDKLAPADFFNIPEAA